MSERGFGWHYPPGTPGPSREHGTAICPDCEDRCDATLHRELGAAFLEPETCPSCGSDKLEWDESGGWGDGPDPDELRDRLYDQEHGW